MNMIDFERIASFCKEIANLYSVHTKANRTNSSIKYEFNLKDQKETIEELLHFTLSYTVYQNYVQFSLQYFTFTDEDFSNHIENFLKLIAEENYNIYDGEHKLFQNKAQFNLNYLYGMVEKVYWRGHLEDMITSAIESVREMKEKFKNFYKPSRDPHNNFYIKNRLKKINSIFFRAIKNPDLREIFETYNIFPKVSVEIEYFYKDSNLMTLKQFLASPINYFFIDFQVLCDKLKLLSSYNIILKKVPTKSIMIILSSPKITNFPENFFARPVLNFGNIERYLYNFTDFALDYLKYFDMENYGGVIRPELQKDDFINALNSPEKIEIIKSFLCKNVSLEDAEGEFKIRKANEFHKKVNDFINKIKVFKVQYENIRKNQEKLNKFDFKYKDIDQEDLEIGTWKCGIQYKNKLGKEPVIIKLQNAKANNIQFNSIEKIKEYSYMISLEHKNILEVYGFIMYKNQLGIVIEYCKNGNLKKYFKGVKKNVFSDKIMEKWKYLKDYKGKLEFLIVLAETIRFCHAKNDAHLRLTPKSVFLTESMEPKIADFSSKNSQTSGISLYFSPPEQILNDEPSLSADVWAFGMIMFYILLNDHPFQCMKKTMRYKNFEMKKKYFFYSITKKNLRPIFTPHFQTMNPSETLLIQQCWFTDRNKRPSMNKIILQLQIIHKNYH